MFEEASWVGEIDPEATLAVVTSSSKMLGGDPQSAERASTMASGARSDEDHATDLLRQLSQCSLPRLSSLLSAIAQHPRAVDRVDLGNERAVHASSDGHSGLRSQPNPREQRGHRCGSRVPYVQFTKTKVRLGKHGGRMSLRGALDQQGRGAGQGHAAVGRDRRRRTRPTRQGVRGSARDRPVRTIAAWRSVLHRGRRR